MICIGLQKLFSFVNKHDTVAGGSVHINTFAGRGYNLGKVWNQGYNLFSIVCFTWFIFVIPIQMFFCLFLFFVFYSFSSNIFLLFFSLFLFYLIFFLIWMFIFLYFRFLFLFFWVWLSSAEVKTCSWVIGVPEPETSRSTPHANTSLPLVTWQ